jgi:hypothetical protein
VVGRVVSRRLEVVMVMVHVVVQGASGCGVVVVIVDTSLPVDVSRIDDGGDTSSGGGDGAGGGGRVAGCCHCRCRHVVGRVEMVLIV